MEAFSSPRGVCKRLCKLCTRRRAKAGDRAMRKKALFYRLLAAGMGSEAIVRQVAGFLPLNPMPATLLLGIELARSKRTPLPPAAELLRCKAATINLLI